MKPPRSNHPLCFIVLILLLWIAAKGWAMDESVAFGHLRRWEGYSQTVYRDGVGYSVGVGHHLGRKAPKQRYTQAEVMRFFRQDYQVALRAAQLSVKDFQTLPADVQSVVIGLIWTCGPTGFKRFTKFRAALNSRDYRAAAYELTYSRWYEQVSIARRSVYVNTLYEYASPQP